MLLGFAGGLATSGTFARFEFGAGLAGVSSYMIEFWPFVVLEAVWVFASLIPLLNKIKST